ncbi:MAG: rhodanese-like domain-containing protein [Clostridia bacterium]|nr:rhodanese-like domain-containing protein [Clostridia bacterium]
MRGKVSAFPLVKLVAYLAVLVVLLLGGTRAAFFGEEGTYTGQEAAIAQTYEQIDQETAREMMAREDGHVVVDVRRQDEYDAGHIPGAILVPNETIGEEMPEALPDLEQVILVYCRSGNRSKQAAEKLADIGYSNVYEFGGIIDWTGEIEY